MKKTKSQKICGRLPGIKKIFMINADELQPGILYQAIAKMPIAINADMVEVSFLGEPELSWESNVINNGYYEKSTLVFDSYEVLPVHHPVCFAIETVEGRQVIIGQRESRYPVMKYKESAGTSSQKAVRTYTITHIARYSVIDVVF